MTRLEHRIMNPVLPVSRCSISYTDIIIRISLITTTCGWGKAGIYRPRRHGGAVQMLCSRKLRQREQRKIIAIHPVGQVEDIRETGARAGFFGPRAAGPLAFQQKLDAAAGGGAAAAGRPPPQDGPGRWRDG